MARVNAACANVRAGSILGVARTLTNPLYQRFWTMEPVFRTVIPGLILGFILIMSLGAYVQTSALRDDTLADAANDLDAIATLLVRELDSASEKGKSIESVLRALTTRHIAGKGRFTHISGLDGAVVASEHWWKLGLG